MISYAFSNKVYGELPLNVNYLFTMIFLPTETPSAINLMT